MLYPLPQSLQPSVRSLFFHLASLTPFVCLQNSQLLNAWQLNRGEQPLVQTLQASTLLPMHLCFLLKSPPRQSRVENCRQTTWLTFWIITSALTFQNKSVYVWVKSNINEECERPPGSSRVHFDLFAWWNAIFTLTWQKKQLWMFIIWFHWLQIP